MSLQEHRRAIDALDAEIVRLLNERTRHVLGIGHIKIQQGQEIYAPHRERAVLNKICGLNQGPITDASLVAIYREIMSSALSLEKSLTIAYLGPEATFTHQAAIKRFGSSLQYASQNSIAEVFQEVSKRRADYGVVPVENSTEGVVTHTLDMFVDSDLRIVAQVILPISHCLASKVRREQIQRLYVHPQTLAQCRGWIQRHFPQAELVETSSNARSAEKAAGDRKSAALCGELAATTYGVPIMERDVQDNAANATRFLVLGRKGPPPSGKDRTSLMFGIRDEVGGLHKAIAPFRKHAINMTKIESRPSKRKAWEYFFFVDCDGHVDDPKVAQAIQELGEHCSFLKVLGSYPDGD
jgi:chorismate mutase/prephenate dehydratase